MRLKYQTGVATLVQFIVMTILNFVNGLVSSVQGCTSGGGDCVSNTVLSLLFFMLIAVWFAFVWVLGYAAQDRRSKRLAQMLLAAEGVIALVSLFDARHYPNILGLITSLVDAALAIWIIVLAWRLMKSGGGRVVTSGRQRRSRARQ